MKSTKTPYRIQDSQPLAYSYWLPPGADRVNIYDTPLQVLAGLLAVGFVLTLLVRPPRAHAGSAPAQTQATAKGTA